MKRAHSLARLNGRILATYSRRTTTALRAALAAALLGLAAIVLRQWRSIAL